MPSPQLYLWLQHEPGSYLVTEWDPPGALPSPPPAKPAGLVDVTREFSMLRSWGLLCALPQKCSLSLDLLGWRTCASVGRAGGACHSGPVYPGASTLTAEAGVLSS